MTRASPAPACICQPRGPPSSAMTWNTQETGVPAKPTRNIQSNPVHRRSSAFSHSSDMRVYTANKSITLVAA